MTGTNVFIRGVGKFVQPYISDTVPLNNGRTTVQALHAIRAHSLLDILEVLPPYLTGSARSLLDLY